MLIIGKGTDPNLNNDVTIAFDKEILAGHEMNWPKDQPEPKGIQEIRDRIAKYEAEHGVVDVAAVHAAQDARRDSMLSMLEGLTKQLRPNG